MTTAFEKFVNTNKQSINPAIKSNNKVKVYSVVNGSIKESGYESPKSILNNNFKKPDGSSTNTIKVGVATTKGNFKITPRDVVKITDKIVPNTITSINNGSSQNVLEISKENNELRTNTYTSKEYFEKTKETFNFPDFKLPELNLPDFSKGLKTAGTYALIGLGLILGIQLIKR